MFSALPPTRETGADSGAQSVALHETLKGFSGEPEHLHQNKLLSHQSPLPSPYVSITALIPSSSTVQQLPDPHTRVWSGVLEHSPTLCNHLKPVVHQHSYSSLTFHPCEQHWNCLIFRQVRGSHYQMELHLCMLSLVHLLSSTSYIHPNSSIPSAFISFAVVSVSKRIPGNFSNYRSQCSIQWCVRTHQLDCRDGISLLFSFLNNQI